MKKILILFTVLFTFSLSAFAEYKPIPKELSKQYKTEIENKINKKFDNNLNNTHFIQKDYLYYDVNSYKYNSKKDLYIIDVMEELDPGGDKEDIICPHGKGYITHLIYTTKYSPEHKTFKVKYKGFMCSIGEYKYKNTEPIEFYYNYKGVYYNNNPHIIPSFNMDYFNNLKEEINNPNEYNYFGNIKNIKNNF